MCCECDGVENKVIEQNTICLTLSDSTIVKEPNCPSKAPMNVQGVMLKLHYVIFAYHLFFLLSFFSLDGCSRVDISCGSKTNY